MKQSLAGLALSLILLAPGLALDPAAVRRAQERGQQSAQSDGQRDGWDYGRDYHYRRGYDDRFQQELTQLCSQQEEQARQRGRQLGQVEGEQQGQLLGQQEGEREGNSQGRSEGNRAGEQRADQQARAEVQAPATREGQQRAQASDATRQGSLQGQTEGDQAALAQARQSDYPRAARDYISQRYARAPKQNLVLPFVPSGNTNPGGGGVPGGRLLAWDPTGPSFRPYPSASYPSPEENDAYRRAYESAYHQAFDRSCQSCRSEHYARGERDACRQAADQAQRRDYSAYFQEGKQQGYQNGYSLRFAPAKQAAYELAYAREFPKAAEESFRSNYPLYCQRHFASISQQAYQETYAQLREAARQKALAQTKAQKYPGYARQQAKLAQQDQERDFRERPLRLSKVSPWQGGKLLDRNLSPGGDAEEYLASPDSDIVVLLAARNFGPATPARIQLLIAEGQGLVYLPENTFASSSPWGSESLITTPAQSLKLRLRPEAAGQKIRLQVILLDARGQSDSQELLLRASQS